MDIILVGRETYSTSSWSGGKTTELFIYPEDSRYGNLDFKFRISSASVEQEESSFTKLLGVDRFISPLDKSLRLTHDNKSFVELQPFEIYEFSGRAETRSFGKAKDFNLMLANGARGSLESLLVQKEHILAEAEAKKETFDCLYSWDSQLEVYVDKKSYLLNPSDLLVIHRQQGEDLEIKINADKKAYAFHGRVLL